jgi:phosphoribosylglycinamide formyltransferase 1
LTQRHRRFTLCELESGEKRTERRVNDARARFGFVVSTAGSVMDAVLHDPFLRDRVAVVVADRPCPGLDRARDHGVPTVLVEATTVEAFCSELDDRLGEAGVDHVLSYYTSFYDEAFRRAWSDRIVNFHPSLLPAFKGMDGFGDAVSYPARFTGNTVELVADVMDEGKIVMQTVCPIDATRPMAHTRHRVFTQQCRALLQVARWIDAGRVSVQGRTVIVAGARFDDVEFSPALERDVVDWPEPPMREVAA